MSSLGDSAVGAVQPKLLFPDGTIQSFGTVVGELSHVPYELYRGLPADAPHLATPRTLTMISGACLAIRAGDFAALRGFDPVFINGQEDSDLCLRLKTQLGKQCRVEPSSVVIHHEGGTPGRGRFSYSNRQTFVERWKDHLVADDMAIYRQDGYEARYDTPDVPEWEPAGLAAFRPALQRLSMDGATSPCLARAPEDHHPSFAIKIACPSEAVRDEWGDYHFARSLAQALQRLGCRSRIDYLRSWNERDSECEIDLVLRGLERYVPQSGRPAILWVISHPDLVEPTELAAYDKVFAASHRLAERWSGALGIDAEPLLQCTDRNLFFPDPADSPRNHEVLFVGNSRNVFRPAVRAAIEAGVEPVVYGTRWSSLIDPRYISGSIVPNAVVADLYRKTGVVLNDHWPDMQQAGILSNRVFDALACAAPIVSDEIPDHPDGYSDLIAEFGPGKPIRPSIEQALNEDSARRAQRRAFADVVRRDHSFDNRAAVILSATRALLARRGRQSPA